MSEADRQWRRRTADRDDAPAPSSEVRLSLVEHDFAGHLEDCEKRQGEIREMFTEVRDGLKGMGERLTRLHVQWLSTALGLVGGAAVFLFGKVLKWW